MKNQAEETRELETQGSSPAEMMVIAAKNNYTPDQVMKMLDAQERYDAIIAKKAYNLAMAEFKANPPLVTKDKQNSQYKSMYTTLGNLVNTVTPDLSKQGLSHSWNIDQSEKDKIKVTCKMTHKLGHSEIAEASAPADVSGAKNPIQQIKSTITYLKSVTFESITGLASTDSNFDDDGKHSQAVEMVDEKDIAILEEYFQALEVNEADFLKYMKIESLEDMTKADYPKAINALKTKAQTKRKPQ